MRIFPTVVPRANDSFGTERAAGLASRTNLGAAIADAVEAVPLTGVVTVSTAVAVARSSGQAAAISAARSEFERAFTDVARDPARFHSIMKQSFGPGYDVAKAESLRLAALRGDYSWLPNIRFVGAGVLGGAHGAYDASSKTVLLSEAMLRDPKLAAATLFEEVGHHLDTQLNRTDTAGDEGEMFRLLLSGRTLTPAQIAAIRADDDHGFITVDGKRIAVEFWNPIRSIGRGLRKVGRGIEKGARAVGRTASKVGRRVYSATRNLVVGVKNAAVGTARNVYEGSVNIGRGIARLVRGDTGGFAEIGKGLLKIAVQTPVDGVIMVGGRAISTVQVLLGIEPPGRGLTAAEIAELRKVYGDSVDYSKIVIKKGDAGVFSANKNPFTHGNTIYMKDTPDAQWSNVLVHEVAHIWQHQHGGTDFMSEALISQKWGAGYDWATGFEQGKTWSQLEPEQQAALIEHAYEGGLFEDPTARLIGHGVDYTVQARAAIREMRAGRGAP